MKKELVIRPAWQVEEPDPDPDVVGIYLDDKIIIPEEIKDPPLGCVRRLGRSPARIKERSKA